MAARLFGIETEYALGAADTPGGRARGGMGAERLMQRAHEELALLPDDVFRGVFLENGARFYVDSGGHPEFTTPECANPWDVVRYVRAGETILLRLARPRSGRRHDPGMAIFRCNVDYSGAGSTWGCHESYLHRADPRTLPQQIIPHLASRVVYTGAGGFNNLSPGLEFTLSPRAVHISREKSSDSTSNRGIFHTKDEPLSAPGYHRLHVICGESLCSGLATWLRSGATALVVAMSEAGLGPGDAVRLRAPLAAMHRFANDPECSAAAETAGGRPLTAVDVQRHYLELAEAHVRDEFMPPWAPEVCRRWRELLGRLAGGWGPVATTLDWAIKFALYTDRLCRRGLGWQQVAAWNHVARRLVAALGRVGQRGTPLSAALVLSGSSPVAEEVSRLTPLLRERGLRWEGFAPFIEARHELFEIDMRFGQLGERGLFSALDAAGALAHHVDGTGGIDHAVGNPPDVGRGGVRGRLVRELSGAPDRYCCGWQGVWDFEENRTVDLSDPFAEAAQWMPCSAEAAGLPSRGFRSLLTEHLWLMFHRQRVREAGGAR